MSMKFKQSFNKNILLVASSMMAAIVVFLYGSLLYGILSTGKSFDWIDMLKPFKVDQVKDITAFIQSMIVTVIEFCIECLKTFLKR